MGNLKVGKWVCGSCAIDSIGDIGTYMDPESVLIDFCKNELVKPEKDAFYRGRRTQDNKYNVLAAFYVFCAGPEVPSNAEGGSCHSKPWVRYGTEFAAYLTSNGLGSVVATEKRPNTRHHPRSTAQVWVWSPNQDAVQKWWEEHRREK